MSKQSTKRDRPSPNQIREEIRAGNRRQRMLRIALSTIGVLLTAAAIVVLIATFLLPTMRIYGDSMTPTLTEGEIVVSVRSPSYKQQEIIAFYYNNKILVKRVICGPGDWFNMDEDGTVYVNSVRIEEPYVSQHGFGKCDLELPYQVPDDEYFVMGDQRETSVDSRMEQIGCVPKDRIVGRLFLRVWPWRSISTIG